MNPAATVLLAVAKELAQRAKDSLPKLREGERISQEWLDSGVYYRETTLNGETYLAEYDFMEGEAPPIAQVSAPKKRNRKARDLS